MSKLDRQNNASEGGWNNWDWQDLGYVQQRKITAKTGRATINETFVDEAFRSLQIGILSKASNEKARKKGHFRT